MAGNRAKNLHRYRVSALGVGLSVSGLTAFVRSGLQAADEMSKLSQRLAELSRRSGGQHFFLNEEP